MSVMKKMSNAFRVIQKLRVYLIKELIKHILNMEDIYIIISKYLLGTASPTGGERNHGMAEC